MRTCINGPYTCGLLLYKRRPCVVFMHLQIIIVYTCSSWSYTTANHCRIHLQLMVVYNRRPLSYTPAAHGRINQETIVVYMVVYTCGSRSYTVHTYTHAPPYHGRIYAPADHGRVCTSRSWSYTPAEYGRIYTLCTGDQHYIPYKLLLIS
jgi:hypothetical protein